MLDRRPIRDGAGINSQLEGEYYVDPEVNDVEIDDSEGGKLRWSLPFTALVLVFISLSS